MIAVHVAHVVLYAMWQTCNRGWQHKLVLGGFVLLPLWVRTVRALLDLSSSEDLAEWMRNTRDPHVLPCWTLNDERQRSRCCSDSSSSDHLDPLAVACFDKVYRREECCPFGSATMIPLAVPDGLCHPWHPTRSLLHPARSREQKRFEHLHRYAIRFQEVGLFDVQLKIVDFKTSQKAEIVADELTTDPYRIIALAEELAQLGVVNATFVDVGANLGLVSMLLAKMIPGSQVLALEPVPELYRFLLWNLKINGLESRVWALNAGLGSEHCLESVYPLDPAFWWLPANLPWAKGPCISFPDLLSYLEVLPRFGFTRESVVDLLKIDCEGCEYDAFASESNRDQAIRRVRRFAGEVHESCYACAANSQSSVLELLCGHRGKKQGRSGVMECDNVLAGSGLEVQSGRLVVDRFQACSVP